MNHDFSGKVALVTGGASGMGLATVKAFAKAGASVVVADINGDAAQQVAAFNNAGVQSIATETADYTSEEYDRVVNINLRGLWLCMKYELQQMRKQQSGAIVNCSSLGGFVGVPGRGAYHAAKHGVLGLTKTAALEYAAQGIRINAVCPGIIDTPMVADMKNSEKEAMDILMEQVPARRLGTADEVAQPVLWLCGPGSTFVMGHVLAVDGAYTVR